MKYILKWQGIPAAAWQQCHASELIEYELGKVNESTHARGETTTHGGPIHEKNKKFEKKSA